MTPPLLAFSTRATGLLRELVNQCRVGQADMVWKKGNPGKQRPVGSFVEVNTIWDTGATDSVISPKLVKQLGLIPIGKETVFGITGSRPEDAHVVDLILPNNIIFRNHRVTEGQICPDDKLDLLIGMDIILAGDFNISNHNGQTHFSFSVPAHYNRICLLDRANKVNNRKSKKGR